ncbi:MAG: helix-turn-helix transcriptional regulator, partial [Pirellulaceae bacterium]
SDVAVLDLLRRRGSATVSDLVVAMDVTATAVRQRLTRLVAQGLVERSSSRGGRGRPSHHYLLSAKGRRKTGANFADLALALWREIHALEDSELRRTLLGGISRRLAEMYAESVEGESLAERMESLAELFNERRIPFAVESEAGLPVLTALACPYPDLAEQDRDVCVMERELFTEVLGENMRLDQCRLDGGKCCQFATSGAAGD